MPSATANPDTKGKNENARKKPIRTDARYYEHIYATDQHPLSLADQEFRFEIIREDLTNMDISGLVESMTWQDDGTFDNINSIPVLRGSAGLRKPPPDDPLGDLNIHDGHVVRAFERWGGRWRKFWDMRILKETVAIGDGTWTFDLADDLVLLSKSTYTFDFQADKKAHPKGFRYWEIVQRICAQAGVPLDHAMPQGERWIKDFHHKEISPLEAIREAVQMEMDYSGQQYIIKWDDGKVRIKRLRRNTELYTLSNQIRTADVSSQRTAQVWTAVTGRGSGKVKDPKTGKETTKNYKVTLVDSEAVKKYGYIHVDFDLGTKVDSNDEAKKLVQRHLEKGKKAWLIVENFVHYGIASTRRGDAVKISIPEEDITGNKGIMFVYSVDHSLEGGDYTMTLSLTFLDPDDPNKLRAERERALRAQKRGQKGKKNHKKGAG